MRQKAFETLIEAILQPMLVVNSQKRAGCNYTAAERDLLAVCGRGGIFGGLFNKFPSCYVNITARIYFVMCLPFFIFFSRMPYRQKRLSACPGPQIVQVVSLVHVFLM